MTQVEEKVRSVKTDGLVWGASKLVPVAYGIKALQITCVVEDDKVSGIEVKDWWPDNSFVVILGGGLLKSLALFPSRLAQTSWRNPLLPLKI